MNLEPVYMYMYYKKGDFNKMLQYHILDCFECGSCSFTCPANRPLVDMIRVGKAKTGAMIRARNAK